MKSAVIASLVTSVLSLGTAAEAANDRNIWTGLSLSGSDSLLVWALSDPALPDQALEMRAQILHRMGFGPGVSTRFTVTPVLTWDPNINGGFMDDGITIGGLRFSFGEDTKRIGGLMAGVQAGARIAAPITPDLAFTANLAGQLTWSPEHDMTKVRLGAETCLRYALEVSTSVHACATATRVIQEMGAETRYTAQLGMRHQFVAGAALHELRVDYTHLFRETFDQGILGARLISAHTAGYSTSFGVRVGASVDGSMALSHGFDIGLTTILWDRPTSFSISYDVSDGGRFLGQDRRDKTVALSVGRDFGQFSAEATIFKTSSSASFYNDSGIGVNFSYRF